VEPSQPCKRTDAPSSLIERIIDYSARNKFLIFVLTLCAIAGGSWGLYNTPLVKCP